LKQLNAFPLIAMLVVVAALIYLMA